jgi:hypothetical protein
MRELPPIDDETVAALEAIDATLHGEPVDPDLAALAELSLILRDERPQPTPWFLSALDARVAGGFPAAPRTSARPVGLRRRVWWGAGSALAGVAAVVLVLVAVHLGSGGHSGPGVTAGASRVSSNSFASSSAAAAAAASGSGSGSGADVPSAKVPAHPPAPPTGRGRDLTQSAQLTLRARAGRIDGVAQQVFDVVGLERGTVQGSHVLDRARGTGSARFTLQVPSGRLQATLTRLSSLHGATVTSRADASADITGAVNTTAGRLAAAHALRRSLLAQLAAADTATLAGRLQASLRRNESVIVADETSLARLHVKVTDSTIDVVVTAPAVAARRPRRSTGDFSIHRGLHDAGRVLVVTAGVALIVLAVLIPLGVLVAIAAWAWALTLRRRRNGALGP